MRRTHHGFDVIDDCKSCVLRNGSFFCNVNPSALSVLNGIAFANIYPEGAILFSEGDKPHGVFLLCRGTVKMSAASGDGKTLITRIARRGEALGLTSVISSHVYSVSAETLEPCQVKFIRADDFIRWMNEYHDVCRHAALQLTDECEEANAHIRALGLSHSAAEKLAHLLIEWKEARGRETSDGTRVQMLMTHQDISQLIGTSRETVTRLFREFRDRKLISVRGSTLTIHNAAALEALITL